MYQKCALPACRAPDNLSWCLRWLWLSGGGNCAVSVCTTSKGMKCLVLPSSSFFHGSWLLNACCFVFYPSLRVTEQHSSALPGDRKGQQQRADTTSYINCWPDTACHHASRMKSGSSHDRRLGTYYYGPRPSPYSPRTVALACNFSFAFEKH